MNHQDLALELSAIAGIDGSLLTDDVLNRLQADLEQLVDIQLTTDASSDPESDGLRTGLGFLHFKEQRFYSVKLGNALRDRLGSLGVGGALLSSSTGIAKLVTNGELSGWTGASALAAILLALVGRGKPFVTPLSLDEATTLALAWRHSRVEHGFRLVALSDLTSNIGEVERIYRNAGFTQAKVKNALNKLIALGMIVEASGHQYQLMERIKVEGVGELALDQG